MDERARVDGVGRFKELLAVAVLPVLTGYTAVATVLATVAALATESHFSATGVLLAAGPGWLAAYQVPVVIGGNELGLLPLALTIGVCALVARSAFGAVDRLGYRTPRQAGVVIGTVAGTHAVVGVTIAVLANGAIVTADPLHAFAVPGLVSGAAATVGVARRCGLLDVLRPHVDAAAIAGMRAAALGMAGLLATSALVLTAATAFAVPTMQTLFAAHAPGFGSGFGMLLLCLGYVPNAVLAVLAFLLGPGFTLGATSLGPVHFEGGLVPAVPVLAGIPENYAVWWPALFLLPALIGAGVGWTLRASSSAPVERLRSVAVAGALIGFATVVLTTLAGGGLGGGPLPGLLLPAGLLSVAAFAWIFLPGALVAWLAGPRVVSDAQDAVSDVPDAVSDAQDAVSDVPDAVSDVPDAVSDAQDAEFDVEDAELDGAETDTAEEASDSDAADASDPGEASDTGDGADDSADVDGVDAAGDGDSAGSEGAHGVAEDGEDGEDARKDHFEHDIDTTDGDVDAPDDVAADTDSGSVDAPDQGAPKPNAEVDDAADNDPAGSPEPDATRPDER
ncbi:cell division protein PerM [Haloechinothrix halophila]|uniref:cell division protein PerM n=1 Tax=Haloechinothrix halophila TaxID=1069073 RepID=UPI0012FBA9FA|nr:DUF6350 family protein [Haloechinothrix halophila]